MKARSVRRVVRWVVVLVVLGAAAAGGWFGYERYKKPTITYTQVVTGPVVQAFYATGTLSPDQEYAVNSSAEGIVLPIEKPVDKGAFVHKGQVVAMIRVEEYELRYRQSLAELELRQQQADVHHSPVLAEYDKRLQAATNQLTLANDELERVKAMRQGDGASKADLDRSMDRVQTVWSQVESIKEQKAARKLELDRDVKVAQAALDITQWNRDQQTIKSPIDGLVLDRPTPPGTRVKINDRLMTIADVRPQALIMRANINEEDKTRLFEGQPVRMTLYSYPGRSFDGKVTQIYPKADPARRTFEVDVTVTDCDQAFSAGMTSELAFIVAQRQNAVVVPSQAVTTKAGADASGPAVNTPNGAGGGTTTTKPSAEGVESRDATVWLYESGKVRQVSVRIGMRSVERTEIITGLTVGAHIVVSPTTSLAEAQEVYAKAIDPDVAAGLNKKEEEKAMSGFN